MTTGTPAWPGEQRKLSEAVTVLVGGDEGRYPSGNSVLVQGSGETVIIDPSVTVVGNGGAPAAVDAVINSHAHEDHVAGNGLFSEARVHIHEADRVGITSLDGLLNIYGLHGDARGEFATTLVEEFSFTPRPDAEGFGHGHVFDLGGTSLEAVHLPGHTRGHSGFRIDGGVFFLSDIDLTGFGPYYGDVWSSLDDFDESLHRVRDEEADFYVTFHHKGIIEGRAAFLELLDGFHAVINRRHQAMLEFLAEPHTVADMTAHRFIYRPHVEHTFADSVETRSAELHIARMLERGEATEVEPGRYQRS
jgi:glyoxylase-like metal-dependent hydrolase (beta-lactamase superfamily II)